MKELSIKQKAKRYDEISKEVKDFIDGKQKMYNDVEQTLNYLFPELEKESEDERIRKALIDGFTVMKESKNCGKTFSNHNIPVVDIIAWLEKQGKLIEYYEDKLDRCACTNFNKGYESALEAIKKEKVDNSNKIEPKFKVGDWVILTEGELSITLQIVDVDTNKKLYWFNDNSYLPIVDEECLRHWTLQDAKAGDVLFYRGTAKYSDKIKYERICLFNNLDNAFFTLTKTSNYVEEYEINANIDYPDNIVLATKEQQDILFMAMADAGYTFDFEKKELKKIV